jgi:hypothetical protein
MTTPDTRPPRPSAALLLALMALACQEPTAPDRAPSGMETAPERQDLAGLVDRTHWADGYLWANNPTGASYAPSATYAFNRTGGAIQITKPSGTTGRYIARFNGLSNFLGNKSTVHVNGILE